MSVADLIAKAGEKKPTEAGYQAAGFEIAPSINVTGNWHLANTPGNTSILPRVLQASIVQIETIDVCDCSHLESIKSKGSRRSPRTLPTKQQGK